VEIGAARALISRVSRALILPPLMVVFGLLTLFDSIRRNGTALAPELLLEGDLDELTVFAVLTLWALLARRDAASHKRLMILGTMAILGPAIGRWPIPFSPLVILGIYVGLPLLVVAYDLWSRRSIHRSTAIAYAMIVAVTLTIFPVSRLGFWQQVIAWIRHT
jgi:hypothetical protein